jgi:ketosteroid isomerase-like protein
VSRDKVEIFRETLAAFDRRDRDAWLADCHEDHEMIPSATWPEADVVRGREAVWDFYLAVTEQFEWRAYGEDVEVIDPGGEKLVVHQRSGVRGRASGADVELDYWVVMTFRDGQLARHQWFADRAEAIEAAEL